MSDEPLAQRAERPRGHLLVDLDGTLARYDGPQNRAVIGPPVPLMQERVLRWLARGTEVRIFTARATDPAQIPMVEAWCERHLGAKLPVTNVKTFEAYCLYDDRARQVKRNTGEVVGEAVPDRRQQTLSEWLGSLADAEEG